MGSRKNEATGISLLSMYNDEDDEMEDAESESDAEVAANEEGRLDKVDSVMGGEEEDNLRSGMNNRRATEYIHTLQQPGTKTEQLNDKKMSLNFVDYGHDEVAMSPEAVEKGEIHAAGQDTLELDLPGWSFGDADGSIVQLSEDGQLKDGTGTISVRLSTKQVTTVVTSVHIQTSQIISKDEDMCEINGVEGTDDKNQADMDPLNIFLPPPPVEKCSQDLQDKINRFLALKKSGKSFNKEVRNKKDYRNPDFLLHAVTYQEIDQIGSCFSKDIFDPHGYDKSDYYDEIDERREKNVAKAGIQDVYGSIQELLQADMKHELERKEQERKKNQKLEFITGGVQPGIVPTTLKPTLPSPDAVPREGRQNKKSKWDKVDGDQGSQLGAGQDSRTAVVGAHTALSSANAGAGYTAFAQQRRREAEEKKSSERRRAKS